MNKIAKKLRRCKISGEIASDPPWFKQVFERRYLPRTPLPLSQQPLAQYRRYPRELYTAGTFIFHVDDGPTRCSRKENIRVYAVTNRQV